MIEPDDDNHVRIHASNRAMMDSAVLVAHQNARLRSQAHLAAMYSTIASQARARIFRPPPGVIT